MATEATSLAPALPADTSGSGPRAARWIAWLSALAAALAVAVLLARGFSSTLAQLDNGTFAADFDIYFEQGRLLNAPSPAIHGRWLYPPLLAAIMRAFALLDRTVVFWSWYALQLALIAGLIALCRRELAALGRVTSWAGAVGLTVASLPVIHCLKWGQISIALLLLCVSGLCRGGWTGAGLFALAASIKLYPVFYALLPLARRRFGFLARVAAAGAVLGIVLPALLLGPQPTAVFLTRALSAGSMLWADHDRGDALGAAIHRWFHAGVDFGAGPQPWLFALPEGARIALTWGIAIALLAATLRRALARPERDLASAVLLITVLTMALRPAWIHYYVVLPLAQAMILGRAATKGVLAAGAAGWLLTAAPLFAFFVQPGYALLSSSLGLMPLAALVTWWGLWRASPEQRAA